MGYRPAVIPEICVGQTGTESMPSLISAVSIERNQINHPQPASRLGLVDIRYFDVQIVVIIIAIPGTVRPLGIRGAKRAFRRF